MSKEKIGRIGGEDWTDRRNALTTAVYNASYSADGVYLEDFPSPWTVAGPGGSKRFTTHAEALAWAFEKAEAGK